MNSKIKVLMADDEDQFRKTTKKILERRGFETIMAGSGEEALEKLKENPNVVVLDIKMTGMDGLQTLKEIKKLRPEIPVIMLTGFGTEGSAQEALKGEAFDYLNKPCEIDLLASKIISAYQHREEASPAREIKVSEIMIPIGDYTTMSPDATIKDAILELKKSFTSKISTKQIMETGHRSLLVLDEEGKAEGILTIFDLLQSTMPAYLNAPRPSTADTVRYSPMFWKGMFYREIKMLGDKKIKDIMSPAPITIDGDACLMEAAYRLVTEQVRRLAVIKEGKVIGIIREQDLFFEMERILTE